MYGFLWRHIPGSWPVKLTVFVAGIFGIVLVLFQFAFPAAEPHLPWSHDTVGTTVQQQVVGDYSTGSAPAPGTGTGSASSPTALPGD